MKRSIRDQVVNITVPTGTIAGQPQPKTIDLDHQFEKAKGVRVVQKANGGDPDYEISLRNSSTTIQDYTHNSDWLSNTSVPLKDRAKPIDVGAKGEQITIEVKPSITLGEEIKLQVIFELTND